MANSQKGQKGDNRDRQKGSGRKSRRDRNQSESQFESREQSIRQEEEEMKRFANDDTLESDSDWV